MTEALVYDTDLNREVLFISSSPHCPSCPDQRGYIDDPCCCVHLSEYAESKEKSGDSAEKSTEKPNKTHILTEI